MQIQVAPLPKVVNVNSLSTVMWMVLGYHEYDFTGFTVSATPYSSMEWKTLVTFPHENESGEIIVPDKAIIPLGRYAERFCRMRLTLSSIDNGEDDGEDEGEGKKMCYAISNIAFSNVYKQGSAIKSNKLSSGVREYQLSGLTTKVGTRYCIKVEGTTKEDPVYFGETFTRLTSDAVSTAIIEKVESITGEVLTDAVLLEGDLDGLSGLRVTCNDAVTELRAYPSCLTLISDADIKIYRRDEHVFDVIIDSKQTIGDLDGSRMLITLEA